MQKKERKGIENLTEMANSDAYAFANAQGKTVAEH